MPAAEPSPPAPPARFPRLVSPPVLAILALLAAFVVFAPRLSLMTEFHAGSYQWTRAEAYLKQCADPFRKDIEPAMVWRLLPPLVAHQLGLRGNSALVLPIVGLVAFMLYVATLLHRRSPSPAFVFGGCLLVASSSAALVPFHWLGLNDAWIWLALLAVAFAGHAERSLILACLLAPWVDERFVIGLPLALLVRQADRPDTGLLRAAIIGAAALAPYLGLRLILRDPHSAAATDFFVNYIKGGFLPTVPWAHLGWFMAYRLGWVPIAFALHRHRFPLGLVTAATLVTMLLLAADISRSAAIVCPALLLGLFIWARERPTTAARDLLLLGVFNLLVPAMHVVYNKTDLISPLPIELYRLLRGG